MINYSNKRIKRGVYPIHLSRIINRIPKYCLIKIPQKVSIVKWARKNGVWIKNTHPFRFEINNKIFEKKKVIVDLIKRFYNKSKLLTFHIENYKLLLVILLLSSCIVKKEVNQTLKSVGDIAFDESQDGDQFTVCNENAVLQYFNFNNDRELVSIKPRIDSIFQKNFKNQNLKGESGIIRIRFIVNCKGQAGRFRVSSAGLDLKEKIFHNSITTQLLRLTKEVNFWKIAEINNHFYDYYYYLIFKLEDGNLKEILP